MSPCTMPVPITIAHGPAYETGPKPPFDVESVSVRLEWVTPEKAAFWLESRVRNRNVLPRQVWKIQRDILNNEWNVTHQGIAFNQDGQLYDGQNRLTAISGLSGQIGGVWILVWRGFNQKAMLHTDGQRPRNMQNYMQILGKNISSRAGAVVRLMELAPTEAKASYSRAEEARLWDTYGEAATFGSAVQTVGVSSGVAAAIARAWLAGEDELRLREFQEILKTGLTTSKGDYSAVMLRNFLLSTKGSASHCGMQRYRKTQNAIRYFLDRSHCVKLYGTEKDLFPIPSHIVRVGAC